MLCIYYYKTNTAKKLLHKTQFSDIINYIHDFYWKGTLYMGSLLNEQELKYLKNRFNARAVSYAKNETIMHMDFDTEQLCFLSKGTVYLCAENEQCERSILNFFRCGEYFTSAMLIPSDHAVSYAYAKYPCEVFFLNRTEIFRFCAANPDWLARFMSLMTEQGHRNAYVNSFILHQRTIREKLTAFIRQEQKYQQSDVIRLPIPYTDLAELLACDRSAMMKELSRMKKDGIITADNKNITLNPDQFSQTAKPRI